MGKLGLLAGVPTAVGNEALMKSDLVKADCQIDTTYEA